MRRRAALTIEGLTAAERPDGPRVVQLRNKAIRIEVLPRGYIGHSISLYGIWEITGTRLMELLLRPGMRFVDVGANIGYYTLLAAFCVGDGGCVCSFEPHPAIRALLEHSVRINGLTNVRIRGEAVMDRSGVTPFYSFSHMNEGVSSTIASAATQAEPSYLPAITLDELVLGSPDPRVDVLKIDVEGAELQVLQGMQQLLASPYAPSAILYETSAVSEFAHRLESSGYRVMAPFYSLGQGLEFLELDDRDTIKRRMTDYQGQPTLDYLALKTDSLDAFRALAARSRGTIRWPWRVMGRLGLT